MLFSKILTQVYGGLYLALSCYHFRTPSGNTSFLTCSQECILSPHYMNIDLAIGRHYNSQSFSCMSLLQVRINCISA